MSGFLDWKYIDAQSVSQLENCCDETQIKRLLGEIFNVQEYPEQKQEILVDFHFQTYAYCKRTAFNARQISTLLSIMNEILLEDSRSSTLTNSVEESFKRFQKYVLKHSVERPPKSVQIFQSSDVEGIVSFALESYFRSFRLYSYVFGVQTLLTVKQIGAGGVEFPAVALPLHTGKPLTPRPADE